MTQIIIQYIVRSKYNIAYYGIVGKVKVWFLSCHCVYCTFPQPSCSRKAVVPVANEVLIVYLKHVCQERNHIFALGIDQFSCVVCVAGKYSNHKMCANQEPVTLRVSAHAARAYIHTMRKQLADGVNHHWGRSWKNKYFMTSMPSIAGAWEVFRALAWAFSNGIIFATKHRIDAIRTCSLHQRTSSGKSSSLGKSYA